MTTALKGKGQRTAATKNFSAHSPYYQLRLRIGQAGVRTAILRRCGDGDDADGMEMVGSL